MSRRAITRALGAGFIFAWIAACGGRVDGSSSSRGSGTSGGATTSPTPQLPPGGGRPGRPPLTPMTAASIASQIAESYCKAFSSCCVGTGQPPIDVSRCRELTSASVEQKLAAAGVDGSPAEEVVYCVQAIHDRTAACGKEDVAWRGTESALFAPASVQKACLPLLGTAGGSSSEPCSKTSPCSNGQTCAIDECSSDPALGASCPGGVCLDSAACRAGSCVTPSAADVAATCESDAECHLGLVCAKGQCAPAREHPELYTPRSSPYRVGADTCRAFTYL